MIGSLLAKVPPCDLSKQCFTAIIALYVDFTIESDQSYLNKHDSTGKCVLANKVHLGIVILLCYAYYNQN